MADVACRCECGSVKAVSEFAVGSKIRCASCGRTFLITDENTKPVKDEAPRPAPRVDIAADTAPPVLEGAQYCARCKRIFKGEWDRYHSPAGIVCHVCAHLAPESPLGAAIERPKPVAPSHSELEAAAPVEQEPPKEGRGTLREQFEEFKETKLFRGLVWGGAVFVIGLAILASRMDNSHYTFHKKFSPEERPEGGGIALFGAPEEMSRVENGLIRVLFYSVSLFAGAVACFVPLMLTLAQEGRLPHYRPLLNYLHVGAASCALSVVFTVSGVVVKVLMKSVPLGAGLYITMAFMMILYIIYEIYDLRLRALLFFAVLLAVAQFLIAPVKLLIYGLLGQILF